jgi:hypothetical protein
MFKRTMVAVSTTRLLALVHIITMGPVTLKALVAMTSVVEDSVSASCFFVAPVNPRAKVKLSANRTTASLLCDLVGLGTVQLGAVKLGRHALALN